MHAQPAARARRGNKVATVGLQQQTRKDACAGRGPRTRNWPAGDPRPAGNRINSARRAVQRHHIPMSTHTSPRDTKKAFVEVTFTRYSEGPLCFIPEDTFDEPTFDDAHDQHCDAVCEYIDQIGEFVLFSEKACNFVASVLAKGSRAEPELEAHDLPYSEVFAVYYFAVNSKGLYYEDNDEVKKVTVPEGDRDRVATALHDVAKCLYEKEKSNQAPGAA